MTKHWRQALCKAFFIGGSWSLTSVGSVLLLIAGSGLGFLNYRILSSMDQIHNRQYLTMQGFFFFHGHRPRRNSITCSHTLSCANPLLPPPMRTEIGKTDDLLITCLPPTPPNYQSFSHVSALLYLYHFLLCRPGLQNHVLMCHSSPSPIMFLCVYPLLPITFPSICILHPLYPNHVLMCLPSLTNYVLMYLHPLYPNHVLMCLSSLTHYALMYLHPLYPIMFSFVCSLYHYHGLMSISPLPEHALMCLPLAFTIMSIVSSLSISIMIYLNHILMHLYPSPFQLLFAVVYPSPFPSCSYMSIRVQWFSQLDEIHQQKDAK
jgi:hypothetical protein